MATERAPNTYTLLTAAGVLRDLGIVLTNEEVEQLIRNPDAIQRHLLTPYTKHIVNQHLLDYGQELADYCQHELEDRQTKYRQYLESNKMQLDEEDPTFVAMNDIKDHLGSLSFRQRKLSISQQELHDTLIKQLKQKWQEWDKFQQRTVDDMAQSLLNDGFTLADDFKQKLRQQLNKPTPGDKDIPAEALKKFNIKNRPPTFIEKAVIRALYL